MRKIAFIIILLCPIVQAADTKLTGLDELTAIAGTDILYVVDDPSGTPLSKKITATNIFDLIDTFSELNTIVADKTLVNEEDAVAWDALGTFGLGITITTGDPFTFGVVRWDNGSDLIDGEQIAADTIDNDSIDWGDMTDLGTDGVVTWGNIAEGELADSTVVGADIKDGEVGVDDIGSDAVKADELDVSDVSDDIAGDIAAGELTDDSVNDDDINWADLTFLTTNGAGVNETYASGWNADVGPPEKDDVYDYLHQIDADDDGSLVDESWYTTQSNTIDFSGATLTMPKRTKNDERFYGFNVWNPNSIYDTDTQICFEPNLPAAITITEVTVTLDADPTTELDWDLKWADAFIGLGNAALIEPIDTTNGTTDIDSGFDDATVAAGKCLYIEFAADPDSGIKQAMVKIRFDYD